MSFVTRRALSTLIPPKVCPQGLGAAQDAARMSRVVSFYEKLPRGAAPEVKPKGLFGRYQARYFGKNPSATRSDTEASKTETTKTPSGHLRTTSTVKKALSFKPVSVNKTFLAAKGATPSTTSKLGEKPAAGTPSTQTGPSSSSAPRPRLVAKSGSALRDSTPRNSTTANGSKTGAAPDASAVWNKNRPAAPPEPKRFTDEELKQRYGIHLATRLQSDEPGSKDKMWADIDDDDDDWAPETIEWTDGTKITLPQADEAPVSPPEPAPAPTPAPVLVDVKPVEVPKSQSPAPVPSASPTVKSSGFGSGRAGLVLKGALEKPTLVAKPPGPPTPVKSPWAPLPPVDKVTPVAIEIPQAQPPQQSRFGQRDPHGFQAMPPPPAKEIAADDFSRSSWREGNANTSRELYNSQSGRYEPVNENRRGSTRNDARQPAVLQRPQQDGPAEPSAAFQTSRTTAQDSSYSRRRTSSNVSGGSGNFMRRMSRSGHEMPSHDMNRRGSLAAVSDAPSSPSTQQPPNYRGSQLQNQQPWQSHASPDVSHPSPHSTHGQMAPSVPGSVDDQGAPPTPVLSEDQLFADQKKRMQLARELAVKRRKEEEAKEEAAKRERIRIKLEAMGPPPEKPKSKAATPKQDKATPVVIQAREPASEAVPPKVAEESAEAKVTPVHKTSPASAPLDLNKSVAEPRTNGIHDNDSKTSNTPHSGQQDARSSQPWQSNSAQNANRYQGQGPWAAPAQQPSRSVWGPPSNDRTLGNGTFNSELSRVPTMQHPGPIGPPNQNRNSSAQFSQGRGRDGFGARPSPIGPPNRQLDPNLEEQRRLVASSGWAMAPEKIQNDDSLLRQKNESDLAQRREQQAKGTATETSFKDTWRSVKVNEEGDRRVNEEDLQPVKAPEDHGQAQFTDAWRPNPQSNMAPRARDSRFFPNNRDLRLEDQTVPFERPGSPSPPPPTMAGHPAYDGDTAHPHVLLPRPAPVVKLPPAVLAPIGPPKPTTFAAAVIAPAVPIPRGPANQGRQDHASRTAASYQDIRRNPEPAPGGWQDRINSLIGRKNSPPKSHALAVDSSSKNALELPRLQNAATVSLPSLSAGVISTDNGSTVSKPAAEECFEEQQMGSLPVIRVPHRQPDEKQVQGLHATGPRQRSNPRSHGSRGARGGPPRQTSSSNSRGGRPKESGFPSPKPENATLQSPPSNPHHSGRGGHRGGRGNYQNWNRHVSTPVQT
ncbi:putative ATP synthase subunit F, mitochondrial [Amylocarpus encephaloides]|uniref:ATP synthase subunit F, mitochondrial n=1 Tax=Amylocarpus encephaloides TaxID=45428 RepID=A0A9P7YSM4_9HELO|nr:putative ATP synthase subunit F, mitochondrial [Amylocarpus encephaloides]